MERNVMGELNVYRGSGAKPNFSEIARRHGMDRHTVAKYWREGEAAADGRSARGSAFDPLEEVIRAKAQLPGMTKMAVYAFLREGRGEGLPGYGAFTAWCRARDVPFGGVGGREPHPRFETPPGRQLQFDWKEGMRLVDSEGEVFEFTSPRRWPGSRPRQTRSRTAPPACRLTRCSCGRRRACDPSGTSVSSSRWWAT